mmetsp:Transcript_14205/g.21138  ORF Transcript_14205/g.21138 Transcript_14205/m.21138 type:complete len:166 (+) Transcript_14205:684-1181(+)
MNQMVYNYMLMRDVLSVNYLLMTTTIEWQNNKYYATYRIETITVVMNHTQDLTHLAPIPIAATEIKEDLQILVPQEALEDVTHASIVDREAIAHSHAQAEYVDNAKEASNLIPEDQKEKHETAVAVAVEKESLLGHEREVEVAVEALPRRTGRRSTNGGRGSRTS